MSNNTKVLILGGTGMLGSTLYSVFSKNLNFVVGITYHNLPLSHYANVCVENEYQLSITNEQDLSIRLFDLINTFKPNYIINCIGYLDVENAKAAKLINTMLPLALSAQANKANSNTRIIHISTDGVFDGVLGGYSEASNQFSNSIYAETKRQGEVEAANVLNFRCSIFGLNIAKQKSLLNWFLQQPPNVFLDGYENHFWNGNSCLQYAQFCESFINNNLFLSFRQQNYCIHLVLNETVTKYQMLQTFRTVFNRNDITINKVKAAITIDRTLQSKFFPHQNHSFNNVVQAFKKYTLETPFYSKVIENQIINFL